MPRLPVREREASHRRHQSAALAARRGPARPPQPVATADRHHPGAAIRRRREIAAATASTKSISATAGSGLHTFAFLQQPGDVHHAGDGAYRDRRYIGVTMAHDQPPAALLQSNAPPPRSLASSPCDSTYASSLIIVFSYRLLKMWTAQAPLSTPKMPPPVTWVSATCAPETCSAPACFGELPIRLRRSARRRLPRPDGPATTVLRWGSPPRVRHGRTPRWQRRRVPCHDRRCPAPRHVTARRWQTHHGVRRDRDRRARNPTAHTPHRPPAR